MEADKDWKNSRLYFLCCFYVVTVMFVVKSLIQVQFDTYVFFKMQKSLVFQTCTIYDLFYVNFCHLWIAFPNSLGQNQDRQYVDPDLDQNCPTL